MLGSKHLKGSQYSSSTRIALAECGGGVSIRWRLTMFLWIALLCHVSNAQASGERLKHGDEARSPLATKLLDSPLPGDSMAFDVVRFELEDMGFEESSARLRDYRLRGVTLSLVGDPAQHARTFREAIAEEAGAAIAIDDAGRSVFQRGVKLDFDARVSESNFASTPGAEHHEIEPGLWGMFRSGESTVSPDTAIAYEIPFSVTSHLSESVRLGFNLPSFGTEQGVSCFVDNVPRDVPVAAVCRVSVPSNPEARQRLLGALRQARSPQGHLAVTAAWVSPRDYIAADESKARSMAYNLVRDADCKATGLCPGGRSSNLPAWLLLALLLIGLTYSAVRGGFGGSDSPFARKGARIALPIYGAIIIVAAVVFALDAIAGAPLSGLLGTVAVGAISLPWSLLLLGVSSGLTNHSLMWLMWCGVAVNVALLWTVAYKVPRGR